MGITDDWFLENLATLQLFRLCSI